MRRLVLALGLLPAACLDKTVGIDPALGEAAGESGDADAGGDSGAENPAGEIDPDPLYVERVDRALLAWDLGLAPDVLAGARSLGDSATPHAPRNWITVADEECDADGVGDSLRGDCPLGSGAPGAEIVGVCETRVYPDGEIADTTLVVWDVFQEGEAAEEDKVAVLIHELGHCLGLGHSASKHDVMYATTAGADEPSNPELAAVVAAYVPPAEPSGGAAQRFARTTAGEIMRHHELPTFTISGTIGTEPASADIPAPASRSGTPLRVVRHFVQRDGGCADRALVAG